jgi:hypothetical protein
MSKPYLLAFNDTFGTQDQVRSWLDKIPEVTHWRYDMPNAFYIVSTVNAQALSLKLRTQSGHKNGLFIVTEITADSWGYLTGESWYLIRNLRYKPK